MRRYPEALELLEGILPLFRQWSMGSDVLRAGLIIEEAIRAKTLESLSFREISRTVRRSWFRG